MNHPRIIVTTGWRYCDIDAYAGIIGYAELLRLEGHDALAVSTAPLNASIPPLLRQLNAPLQTSYEARPEDEFVLVDISEPDFFERWVEVSRVREVIDHHVGFEKYWSERLGERSQIEFIGAACTLVTEAWVRAGMLERMQSTTAQLLAAGILDNTLNFGAHVTTERDHTAYAHMARIAQLPSDWPETYFEACEAGIRTNVVAAVMDDVKELELPGWDGSLLVSQIAVWDGKQLATAHLTEIIEAMSRQHLPWFASILSLHDGQNVLIAPDARMQHWLSALLDATFDESGVGTTKRLWLRKEIIKAALEHA